MKKSFADTSFWIALLNPLDGLHDRVAQSTPPLRIVTTTAVLLEVMDAFSSERFRRLAIAFWEMTHHDSSLIIVPLDDHLLASALSLFRQRSDKNWSFTDCISFTVMTERGITDALTADHHFEQAGFRAMYRQ